MFDGTVCVAPDKLDVLGLVQLRSERLLARQRRNASHWARAFKWRANQGVQLVRNFTYDEHGPSAL
jgi:hypothetical protein